MSILDFIKEVTKLINKKALSQDEQERLKNILCYLSEWRKNNIKEASQYPQLNFILYNASRKLRTFGYNRLNGFTNNNINYNDEIALLKDNAVDELYKTKSGFILDKAQKRFSMSLRVLKKSYF